MKVNRPYTLLASSLVVGLIIGWAVNLGNFECQELGKIQNIQSFESSGYAKLPSGVIIIDNQTVAIKGIDANELIVGKTVYRCNYGSGFKVE